MQWDVPVHVTKSMTKTKMTIKKITMMFPTKGNLLMIQRMVEIIKYEVPAPAIYKYIKAH